MPGTPVSGKSGRVQLNGTNLNLDYWSVRIESDRIKGTNFESGGFHESAFGNKKALVTFRGMWDGGANPHANPPNIKAGAAQTNVKLYVSVTSNLSYDFPTLNIFTVEATDDVEGRAEIIVTGETTGTFTLPGGVAA